MLAACSSTTAAPIQCPEEPHAVGSGSNGPVDLWFCSGATALAGSLHQPESSAEAAVVFVHGSGEVPRLGADNPVVTGLLEGDIAVLTYDKRGVGDSEGKCCPGDDGDFTDLIADAAAAMDALRQMDQTRGLPVGFYGESQAAWIAPAAARGSQADFLIMTSAPAVSVGEELLHEDLTAEGLAQEEIRQRLEDTPPSGADPGPDIAELAIPMLWVFGDEDTVIPAGHSVDVLVELTTSEDLDLTVVTLPEAGHSLLHHPELFPTVRDWLDSLSG